MDQYEPIEARYAEDEEDACDGGVTLVGAVIREARREGDTFVLVTDKGTFTFAHEQDCCEQVVLEDAPEGHELLRLVDETIVKAERRVVDMLPRTGTLRATFYRIDTLYDYIDLRWMGTSDGWYGVGVDVTFRPAAVSA